MHAVDGVSFTLERGTTLGIVGESGSGKTVLSRSIMGLLPKKGVVPRGLDPLRGRRDRRTSTPKEMRKYWGAQMAMVFQDPMTSLNPVMKIGKQITESIRTHLDVDTRRTPTSSRCRCSRRCGSPSPSGASTSTRTSCRAACASGCASRSRSACGPKLLFADEPTTALDVTVQAQVLDLLEAQQRERYMAMMLVTHDLGVVAGRADEIAVMYAGQVVEKAPTATLFADMKMPYTEALLRSIPKLDRAQPHPARRDPRPAARPRRTRRRAAGSRPLPVRAGPVPRGAAAAAAGADARPRVPRAGSRSARPRAPRRWRATRPPAARPRRRPVGDA